MRWKRCIILFLCMVLFFNCFMDVKSSADSIDDLKKKIEEFERAIENNEKDSESIRENMAEIQGQIEKAEIEIEKIDSVRSEISYAIEENSNEIEAFQKEIGNMNKEIVSLESEIIHMREQYKKSVKFIYVNGQSGFIEALFSAKSLEGIMGYCSFLKEISKKTLEISEKINTSMKEIKENRKTIESYKSSVEKKKEENIIKLAEQEEKKDKAQAMADDLKQKQREYKNTLDRYNIIRVNSEKEIEKNRDSIERIKNMAKKQQVENHSKNADESNVTGEQIIALACEFLGDPYYWSGTRPWDGTSGSGFDCSGLVQYVYKQYGITTGRRTYDQIEHHNGVPVERADLQIGDLVFFGTWSDPHHVGLYMGNNKYIHAPKTGDVIKISEMTRKDFVVGRRFIK